MRAMPGELFDGAGQEDMFEEEEIALTGLHCRGNHIQSSKAPSELRQEINMIALTEKVVGVILVGERTFGSSRSGITNYHTLGTVVLNKENMKAEELRRTMCTQLPSIPAVFIFLTKEGWPVLKQQEHVIKASHLISDDSIITIRKQFEKQRVGVITTNGECLGFIFIDFSWSVRQVRDSLDIQLRESNSSLKAEYKFIENNGWPVTSQQENILTFLDIIACHQICIQLGNKVCPSPILELPVSPTFQPQENLGNRHQSPDETDNTWYDKIRNRKSVRRQNSLPKRRDVERKTNNKGDLVAKPILISYVRAEASQHALDLKKVLSEKDFSVYLDVHEIKTGADWQDALNYAVSNCQFFVPLITPNYGKTQWTNREVKLADVLNKKIIPVNFLDYWPPECLAIQFASTQYIPSKPPECSHEGDNEISVKLDDLRSWPSEYVTVVSEKIADRCLMFIKQNKVSENCVEVASLQSVNFVLRRGPSYMKASRKSSMKRSLPPPPPRSEYDDRLVSRMSKIMETNSEEKELIVISVHPKQRDAVLKLQNDFEKEGYEVWCSVDLQDTYDPVFNDQIISQLSYNRDALASIPEGEIEAECAETERRRFPLKLDSGMIERRQLIRMSSQGSDSSQFSSMTPDKMERLKIFQQKANQAAVIIVIVSADYTKSKTSQKQVYYCEHRKHVVMVKYDQSELPYWFKMLMGNDIITSLNSPQLMSALKAQVKRALNPSLSITSKDETAEAKIQFLVNYGKRKLPVLDTCVYVAGSSKLQSLRSDQICRAVGRELAKVKNITLVTGGFNGAPDIVAKAFFSAKENNRENIDEATAASQEMSVVHILPIKDQANFQSKANQNEDGSFEPASYGKTIFVGDSVRERETVVARLFDTCIVVEGGLGAAHEVEEFIWNDHFVVPVISTGGAASGQYGVPVKIFEAPPCVSHADWSILQEKDAPATDVAKAIVSIVMAVKKSIASHNHTQSGKPSQGIKSKPKYGRGRSKRNKSVKEQEKAKEIKTSSQEIVADAVTDKNSTTPVEIKAALHETPLPRYSKWQRFLRIFAAAKTQ